MNAREMGGRAESARREDDDPRRLVPALGVLFATAAVSFFVATGVGAHAAAFVAKPWPVVAVALWVEAERGGVRGRGRGSERRAVARWIQTGLAWSVVGDVVLAVHPPTQEMFAVGVVAFALAHVAYVKAFTAEKSVGWKSSVVANAVVGGGSVVGAVVGAPFVATHGKRELLEPAWPLLSAYAVVIGVMAWRAVARWELLASSSSRASVEMEKSGVLTALGATLFVVSDATLGFVSPRDGDVLRRASVFWRGGGGGAARQEFLSALLFVVCLLPLLLSNHHHHHVTSLRASHSLSASTPLTPRRTFNSNAGLPRRRANSASAKPSRSRNGRSSTSCTLSSHSRTSAGVDGAEGEEDDEDEEAGSSEEGLDKRRRLDEESESGDALVVAAACLLVSWAVRDSAARRASLHSCSMWAATRARSGSSSLFSLSLASAGSSRTRCTRVDTANSTERVSPFVRAWSSAVMTNSVIFSETKNVRLDGTMQRERRGCSTRTWVQPPWLLLLACLRS